MTPADPNGVPTITLPKSEAIKAREIATKVTWNHQVPQNQEVSGLFRGPLMACLIADSFLSQWERVRVFEEPFLDRDTPRR